MATTVLPRPKAYDDTFFKPISLWLTTTYNQLLSAHGVTMIFFFVTIFVTGIANYMVPIMVGARDMAFPRVNLLGFWLVPVSILLYYAAFLFGKGLDAGWTGYAPLTSKFYN